MKMAIKMTDISGKTFTKRTAVASVEVKARPELIRKIKNGELPKGDCLAAANLAGILAAKNTPSMLPLCHQLQLAHVEIRFEFSKNSLTIISAVKASYATGVEMEALAACAVAALAVYDMAKTEDKDIVITDLKLLKKAGGKSGEWVRGAARGKKFLSAVHI